MTILTNGIGAKKEHLTIGEESALQDELGQLDGMIDALDQTSTYAKRALAKDDKKIVSVKDVAHVPTMETATKSTLDSINDLVVAFPQIHNNYLYTLQRTSKNT